MNLLFPELANRHEGYTEGYSCLLKVRPLFTNCLVLDFGYL